MRALAILCLAAPASAQEHEVATYGALLEQCYEEAGGSEAKAQCVGALSQACMAGEEGGETTLGMSICTQAEAEVWDSYLNAEYQTTMAWAKSMDADDRALFPEFANREETLRAAQRSWIAFRDAQCAFDYAQWGAGSMRHIAGTSCLMEMTAERAMELLAMREGMQ